jgi:hypothetical protein
MRDKQKFYEWLRSSVLSMKRKRRAHGGHTAPDGQAAAGSRATQPAPTNPPTPAWSHLASAPKSTRAEQDAFLQKRAERERARPNARAHALRTFLDRKAEIKEGQSPKMKKCLICNAAALSWEDYCADHAK